MKARGRVAGPGEDDVARLVADQQRAHDARRRGGDVDDADAVGEVVDDPHLAVGARRDRDRLHAHRHGKPRARAAACADVEDLELSVGVFTANSVVPFGDSASGRTWPLSNVTKEVSGGRGATGRDQARGEQRGPVSGDARTMRSLRIRARQRLRLVRSRSDPCAVGAIRPPFEAAPPSSGRIAAARLLT